MPQLSTLEPKRQQAREKKRKGQYVYTYGLTLSLVNSSSLKLESTPDRALF